MREVGSYRLRQAAHSAEQRRDRGRWELTPGHERAGRFACRQFTALALAEFPLPVVVPLVPVVVPLVPVVVPLVPVVGSLVAGPSV